MSTLLTFPAMPLRPVLCSPDTQLSLPVVEGLLHVALTVDDGAGIRPVDESDLEAWNATLEQLLPVALDRLTRESSDRDWIGVDTVPGMALYQADDGRSSSRMLILDHLVDDWPLAGIAVVVPAPDQLIVVPLNDMEDLDALNVTVTAAKIAAEREADALTDQAFWTDGTAWHHIKVEHDGDHTQVYLPAPAQAGIGRLAAMGLVATAGEA